MEAYTFQRTDLASRQLGADERRRLEAVLAEQGAVQIDLGNVESISESFADELFGILVRDKGLDFVTACVKITHASESALRSIAIAMHRRSSQVAA
tara:strand:- start:1033 stop:1320 length:288 start_codon:yes stop_codon:yes gene_type:complete